MHELAIAQGIIEMVALLAAENQAVKILKVTLQVGKLRAVDQDCLLFVFSALAKEKADLLFQDAQLTIEDVPFRFKCLDCQHVAEQEEKPQRFLCPACFSPKIEIISGYELFVKFIDIE